MDCKVKDRYDITIKVDILLTKTKGV